MFKENKQIVVSRAKLPRREFLNALQVRLLYYRKLEIYYTIKIKNL